MRPVARGPRSWKPDGVDRDAVAAWIDRYIEAWTSNDPEDIRALFAADDARYFTAPHREPWVGQDGIAQGWLDRKEEPGTWRFRYEVLATADDLAFVRGWTEYPHDQPRNYSNLWVIRFAGDGACSEFTEWWMGF